MSFGRHRRGDGDGRDPLVAVFAEAPETDGAVWELLAAATAPPRRRELAGEDAAVAAFRAARDRSVPVLPVAPVRLGRLRRLTASATTWVAVLTAAAATAGAAVAASTQGGEPVTRPPIVATTPPPSPTPAAPAPTRPVQSRPAPAPPAPTTPEVDDDSDLGPFSRRLHIGLCRLYLIKDADARRRYLDHPSMRRVIEAAGDRSKVTGYCLRLVGPPPTLPPGGLPGPPPFVPPGRNPFGQPGIGPNANGAGNNAANGAGNRAANGSAR
ncbi:hypothetical protein O7627_25660 [Solwaraspora sp. WMMD1047]|uniref:hypothetical protein n=1 Tax=Solwaraspora sp. WMMD1047 TaxID=3016102 RepID=UPI0024165D0D|nr:hypothetical protein [Solwaraspora sp. WMMD1047]MDG4832670.1 hypothetical protein [Solwaraspora sp. WMMD1047]